MPRRRQALVLRAAGLLSRDLARRLAGPPPVPGGTALEADQALLLRLVDRMRWPALERMPYTAAQAEARREAAVLAGLRLRVDVVELQVPDVGAARLYARRGIAPGGGLIVWLHGGGW